VHYPPNWRQRLLSMIAAPITDQNLRFLRAWAMSEGGEAEWNPLNTTMPVYYFVASDYNSAGVKNYTKATAGVCATVLTLIQGTFLPIVGQLQAGTHTAEQIVDACELQLRVWGTNPSVIRDVLKTLAV
jgi:hypothetical protein